MKDYFRNISFVEFMIFLGLVIIIAAAAISVFQTEKTHVNNPCYECIEGIRSGKIK